jgi:hypothetical protein
MLRQWILFICVSVLVAVNAHAAPPGQSDDADKRRTRMECAAEAARFPAVAIKSPADLLHLSVTTQMLSAELPSKDTPPLARLSLPNADIIATLQLLSDHRNGAIHGFSMLIRDFSPPGSMSIFTTISSIDGRVQLSRDFESSNVLGSTQLIQDAPAMPGEPSQDIDPVRLFITRTNQVTQQPEVNLKLSAPTFVALCRAHPAETQEYLRPIFHDLGQEAAVFSPDPAAVWQVLADDWKPDDALNNSVDEAIAKFNAEDFRVRQSAAHSLHELGEPAALALMHTDRSKFSAAQSSGVDTFLAPYLPLSPDEATRLGKDRDFLLDSQYCGDLALRKLAAARLARVTGRPLEFDPAADDDARVAQIARIREAVPTTATR